MKKMKNLLGVLIVLIASLSFTSCSQVGVDEGTRTLCVKRPYIFGSDGVEILTPGRHVMAWTSDDIPVSVRPKKYKESFDNLNTKDNNPVDFDIYFNLQVISTKVDTLYSKFGVGSDANGVEVWYVNNLQNKLRNIVRDKCKAYEMNPLTNSTTVSKEVIEYVKSEGNKYIKSIGIPVILLDVSMGKVNPPAPVLAEREKTAKAKQAEKTIFQDNKNKDLRNQQLIKNEIARKDMETKRALADKAYKNTMNLTTTQYITILQLENQKILYSNGGAKVVQVTGKASAIVDAR
jgi:regulator of protease activity HflC (stomatin/prohibitin superfamily)